MNTENNTNNKKIALKIEKLNKTLGRRHILHDIDIEAYEGEVFGFLGPNGAGKTTTIKIIVGLLSLDSGDISIGRYNINKNFEKALAGIGGIVENPEMYKHLTGRENLMQYARMRDGVTKERIDEVVELVGLTKRIDEKIKRYSLGMRQRLGIAMALLGDPEFLILDEPMNGLDPAGIVEIRELILKLNRERNITFLISSHILSELSLVATKYGIISRGHIIKEITAAQLQVELAKTADITVEQPERLTSLFDGLLPETSISYIPGGIRITGEIDLNTVLATIIKEEIRIISVNCHESSFEDYYLKTIGGKRS